MTFDPLPGPIADAFAHQAGACRDLGSSDDGITQLLGRGDFHGRWVKMLK